MRYFWSQGLVQNLMSDLKVHPDAKEIFSHHKMWSKLKQCSKNTINGKHFSTSRQGLSPDVIVKLQID